MVLELYLNYIHGTWTSLLITNDTWTFHFYHKWYLSSNLPLKNLKKLILRSKKNLKFFFISFFQTKKKYLKKKKFQVPFKMKTKSSGTICDKNEKFRYHLWSKVKFRYHIYNSHKVQVPFVIKTLFLFVHGCTKLLSLNTSMHLFFCWEPNYPLPWKLFCFSSFPSAHTSLFRKWSWIPLF